MSDETLAEENEVIDAVEADNSTVESSGAGTAPEVTEKTAEEIAREKDQIIRENAFKLREQRRKAEELENRLRQIEQEKRPSAERPEVPPLPDIYADDYEQQVQARDKALAEQARYDAQVSFNANNAELQRQQQERQRIEELNKKGSAFQESATKLGVDMAKLTKAAQDVGSYGLRQDVAIEILSDPQGSLMTLYLHENPQAIDAINNANNITLGSIYADIKQKSASLQKKISAAPSPVEPVKGSGVNSKQRGVEGTVYE